MYAEVEDGADYEGEEHDEIGEEHLESGQLGHRVKLVQHTTKNVHGNLNLSDVSCMQR